MKFLLLIASLFMNQALAIDNPDTPDYVAAFEARILPLENYVQQQAVTTLDYSIGYDRLYRALDKELTSVYERLMEEMPGPARERLRASQVQWIRFAEAEFNFLSERYGRRNASSASVISNGSHRAAILKNRIVLLLGYLKDSSGGK